MTDFSTRQNPTLLPASAHHVCTVIRRQVADEFPHITFMFIPFEKNGAAAALQARKHEFDKHPGGAHFHAWLQQRMGANILPEYFIGMARVQKKKFLSFMAPDKILICALIRLDDFEDMDEVRQHALGLVWQGFALLDYSAAGSGEFYQSEDGIVIPSFSANVRAWHNMLADAFSAVFMQLQGHKGAIQNLGRRRSLMPLTLRPGWRPEDYPYPLVLDAADIVYEEITNFGDSQSKPLKQAMDMTKEIGETFDLGAMTQWSVFARAAQEMACARIDKNIILGAAIHTSEDPYVRATAYMIAEFLNVSPILPADPMLYNAFSDMEISERQHKKACEEIFLTALSQAALQNDAAPFFEQAIISQRLLCSGRPIGWCGPALAKAGEAYQGPHKIEAARMAFDQAMRVVSWAGIQELIHHVIEILRGGQNVDGAMLAHLAAQAGLNLSADAFVVEQS